MLSNFELGFAQFIDCMKMKRAAWRTRKFNESICLMASEDFNLMKKVVINEWMIQRALASPYSRLLNKTTSQSG